MQVCVCFLINMVGEIAISGKLSKLLFHKHNFSVFKLKDEYGKTLEDPGVMYLTICDFSMGSWCWKKEEPWFAKSFVELFYLFTAACGPIWTSLRAALFHMYQWKHWNSPSLIATSGLMEPKIFKTKVVKADLRLECGWFAKRNASPPPPLTF